ncbi:MAG TPA: hypothetical protein VF518_08725 [Polyangia bacterium]
MDRLPELSSEGLIERARGQFEQLMRDVAAAVNAAPEGRVINGSEEQVRDLLGEFRRGVYETALQMRVDAAEAAFSPGGPADSPASAGQGQQPARFADGQRAGADPA